MLLSNPEGVRCRCPENGSTEIWLGTHARTTIADQEGKHGERASGRIKGALLEERRGVRGPCQPVVKRGSVVVRDLRLWHGGCPNLGSGVRVMLAFSEWRVSWFWSDLYLPLFTGYCPMDWHVGDGGACYQVLENALC